MKMHKSVLDLCVGKKLGEGVSRTVYEWLPDPTVVLKVARKDNLYQGIAANIAEFELWEWVGFGEYYEKPRAWLAPVVEITDDGRFMLQKKTQPIREAELPTKVPCWMSDIKQSNVGLLGDTVVFHDYALNLTPDTGLSNKLVKAQWA